jgi:deoxyribodipyrimidine photo-lyase
VADPTPARTLAWTGSHPPERAAALARIARVRPAEYARTRNHLDGAVTGLSPYLTHGVVTLREVLSGVLQRAPLPVQHKLVFELGWREYFRHVWGHAGDRILQSLHAGPRPDGAYDPVLPPDVRHADTGIPAIDRAVQALYAGGTLHNHARMWLASYVVHLRGVHWRAGADWMVAHLLDGDLASNHLSWQWVAGTSSRKPYLFNADNVARYAPATWHSPGTAIDRSYEALELAARGRNDAPAPVRAAHEPEPMEPPLHAEPPADLGFRAPSADDLVPLRGRGVWLVHPWALRAPPPDLDAGAAVIGVALREHHRRWPWPEARWRWVDTAMAEVTARRWWVDRAELTAALAGAAWVRSVDDPHVSDGLRGVARLDPAPTLFPPVSRRCDSFSRWWTATTHGLAHARELL